ncbi:TetR/AcrR family transcriptional regulator [Rothia sp. AR01]|uniref:TetR/AcrR family transcriptional regulator n=1 Tax=Rothia santali TaxID=2949643 RepID=A0A9X2HEH0_9MICC|nr:TetR/AcrR family transcriptional regulator [Rothia santali]MCP3426605.1 TetR/AcrR family transcriptional regulator [Rothia santali]
MPRHSQAARSEKMRRIIEVAVQCFAEAGYDAVSMDEIASRCGVSKPLLYRYFSSKAEIYERALELHSGRFLEALDLVEADGRGSADQALLLLDAFADFADRNDAVYELLFESESLFIPAFMDLMHDFTTLLRARIVTGFPAMFGRTLTGSAQAAEVEIILGSTINIARRLSRAQGEADREMLRALHLSLVGAATDRG